MAFDWALGTGVFGFGYLVSGEELGGVSCFLFIIEAGELTQSILILILRRRVSLPQLKRGADAKDVLGLLAVREYFHGGGLDVVACRAKK